MKKRSSKYFLLVLFPFICTSLLSCQKKEKKGPDWWYITTPSKILGEERVKPKASEGWKLEKLADNSEMRSLLDGRIVTVGDSIASDPDGNLYWLAIYRQKDPFKKKKLKHGVEKYGPFFLDATRMPRAYALFKWSQKKGVELVSRRLDFMHATGIVINPIEFMDCPKGSPLVFGSYRQKMVKDFRDPRTKGRFAQGPRVVRGYCFNQAENEAYLVYESNYRTLRGLGGVAVDPVTGKVWLVFAKASKDGLDEKLEVLKSDAGLPSFFIDLYDLEFRKSSRLGDLGTGVPFEGVEVGKDVFVGKSPNGQLTSCDLARKEGQVKLGACQPIPNLPINRKTIGLFSEGGYWLGTGTILNRKNQSRTYGAIALFDPRSKTNPMKLLSSAHYMVRAAAPTPGGLAFVDKVLESDFGNHVYRVVKR